MDIRRITPTYYVAPQLDPGDMPDVAAAGITAIICNRPDAEVPPAFQADAMEEAARAAGLAFHRLPLTHATMSPENAQQQASLIAAADGPVLAYCASGTRSTVVWTLGHAATMGVDEVLTAARAGGYDLDAMRPTLQAVVARS